ncbi:type II toxin-antitoxin system Phd/YefM family antitoxin, partial [Acidiphilium sp. JA12-A1]|uniref:type II toxin-antitoxin system Phd/YefM family antitoxin n=1 Tax=Acidiphilium sp. JA12-A1 TaxID=1464546 RepID=UPI001F071A4E
MSKSAVIEASAARSSFAKLGEQARRAPVEVTRHGKLEFVVISPDLYEAVKAAGTVPVGELAACRNPSTRCSRICSRIDPKRRM